jgi:DNA-directed RNA polymerase specialized sigma24 family protein
VVNRSDNLDVDEEPVDRYEAALRRLPDAHSLALRLRDAGAADGVICQYLQIEREGLELLLSLAREKLDAELNKR